MVILSVAITTKNGKALLARQYREMSRIRIEGLLTAFPKLANTKSSTSHKQHTFVETDSIRYIYQPLETVFILLITTKSSNIVEDLDTLQLLTRVVKDLVPQIEEGKIVENGFELFFAFDEIISLGYAENLSLDNVRTILEMESQEENFQNMLTRTRIEDAIAVGKKKAAQISKQKAQAAKSSKYNSGVSSGSDVPTNYSAFSGGIGSTNSTENSGPSKIGKLNSSSFSDYSSPAESSIKKPSMWSLKAKKQAPSLLQEMLKEGEVEQEALDENEERANTGEMAAMTASSVKMENVHIAIKEEIAAEIGREGTISKLDMKGEMYLTISDPLSSNIRVLLESEYSNDFQHKTHPNLDKKLFSDKSILGVKSTNKKGFPTKTSLKILTWKLQSSNFDAVVPLTVSCWPTTSSDGLTANIEYELKKSDVELHNLVIGIPLPTDKVNVDDVENGSYKYDAKRKQLVWTIDVVDGSNASGTLEFSLPPCDENSIFPIEVHFTSPNNLSQIRVKDVVTTESNEPVKYSNECSLEAIDYVIV